VRFRGKGKKKKFPISKGKGGESDFSRSSGRQGKCLSSLAREERLMKNGSARKKRKMNVTERGLYLKHTGERPPRILFDQKMVETSIRKREKEGSAKKRRHPNASGSYYPISK